MLSHANILHNEEMILGCFEHTTDSVVVSWLPVYHDMGLIGMLFQPLFVGNRCILMSPMAFMQRPIRWLKAISKYRATTSGGPNFAYEMCVERINRLLRLLQQESEILLEPLRNPLMAEICDIRLGLILFS